MRKHVPPIVALRAEDKVARAVIADRRHGFILLAAAEETIAGLAYAAALTAEHGGVIGSLEELYSRLSGPEPCI